MQLILITLPDSFESERKAIEALFDAGLSLLHIRKPAFSRDEMRCYLDQLPVKYHNRLVLHDHFELAESSGIERIHLNNRNPLPPSGVNLLVSRSTHSIKELKEIEPYQYVFLSPLFDSISKTGYMASFTDIQLKEARQHGWIHEKVIALGGITAQNASFVAEWGFGGVAVIGSIWGDFMQTGDLTALIGRYKQIQTICDQL